MTNADRLVRAASGACYDCAEPAAPGRRRCREHLERAAARYTRKRQRPYRPRGMIAEIDLDDAANAHLEAVSAAGLAMLARGRCACGLLLPCNDHDTITIDHWATRRR